MRRPVSSALAIVAAAACGAGQWACGSDESGGGGQGGALVGGQTGTGGALGGSHQGAGAAGAGTSTGVGGAAGSASCDDTFNGEPNDTPATAVNLLVLPDDDPATWPTFDGVIVDAGDVDWYTYLGTDEPAAYVDPEQAFVPESTDLELCAYFWCTHAAVWGPPEIGTAGAGGGSAYSCPPGTEVAEIDLSSVEIAGQFLGVTPGCCTEPGTGSFHLGETFFTSYWTPFGCSGLTDDMKVFFSVRAHHGASPPACMPYEVEYHF